MIRAWPGGESLSSRTIGVPPTRSRTVGYSRATGASLGDRGRLGGCQFLPPDQRQPCDERHHAQADEHPEREARSRGEGLRLTHPVLDEVVEAADPDRRGDRDPDGAAYLLRRVDQSRREPRLVVA